MPPATGMRSEVRYVDETLRRHHGIVQHGTTSKHRQVWASNSRDAGDIIVARTLQIFGFLVTYA